MPLDSCVSLFLYATICPKNPAYSPAETTIKKTKPNEPSYETTCPTPQSR